MYYTLILLFIFRLWDQEIKLVLWFIIKVIRDKWLTIYHFNKLILISRILSAIDENFQIDIKVPVNGSRMTLLKVSVFMVECPWENGLFSQHRIKSIQLLHLVHKANSIWNLLMNWNVTNRSDSIRWWSILNEFQLHANKNEFITDIKSVPKSIDWLWSVLRKLNS